MFLSYFSLPTQSLQNLITMIILHLQTIKRIKLSISAIEFVEVSFYLLDLNDFCTSFSSYEQCNTYLINGITETKSLYSIAKNTTIDGFNDENNEIICVENNIP